jgi:AcrR family transcriptional regulator
VTNFSISVKNKAGRTFKRKGIGTRERVLAVAQAEFLKKGYGECTLDQIAEAALLSKGTIYQYFSGKDDLMLALKQRFFGEFNTFLRNYFPNQGSVGVGATPSPGERLAEAQVLRVQPRNRLEMRQYLTRFFAAFAEFNQQESNGFLFFLGEQWHKNLEIKESFQILEKYVQLLQSKGLSKSNVARPQLAVVLLSSWVQLIQKWGREGKGRIFNISHTDDFVNVSLDLLRVDA